MARGNPPCIKKKERRGKMKRAREASSPDPAKNNKHTHQRMEYGRGVLRPKSGGVGVHTKQPQCASLGPLSRDGR